VHNTLKLDLIRINGKVEVFNKNSAIKLAIRLDRRERAKLRLARIKKKWYSFAK
jgi:hypothetical protein